MGLKSFNSGCGILIYLSISTLFILLIQNQIMQVNGFVASVDNNHKDDITSRDSTNLRLKYNSRSGLGFVPRLTQIPTRSRIPIELDFILEADNELMEKSKRYDDYGHLRFGKRSSNDDKFDDYGHMRFGRSI